jgi:hypothetical protein
MTGRKGLEGEEWWTTGPERPPAWGQYVAGGAVVVVAGGAGVVTGGGYAELSSPAILTCLVSENGV